MRIFRKLWRWIRREVRDPTAVSLKRLGKTVERAARDWGTDLDEDLAELTSVMALAGALWVAGNKDSARALYTQAQRYAKGRRDALLNAILMALNAPGPTNTGGEPAPASRLHSSEESAK